jgi:hypothetical protein
LLFWGSHTVCTLFIYPQVDPHARVRAPPKKQSSMQKIMAKMKEIKLRVTGRMGESGVRASAYICCLRGLVVIGVISYLF